MPQPKDEKIAAALKEESLRYASDTTPGYFRQKLNGKWSYYDLNGKRITDNNKIERIEALVIPPAWKKVWISPKANGHIQATGIDEKGRKQYIYHPDWIKISQENKFSKMIDFGNALPKIRGKVRYELNKDDLTKEKIIATIIWLLEHTFIRIGNEQYSQENNSFGLTTLRNRHVTVNGHDINFKFKGKSGVEHEIEIKNPKVSKIIKKCIELPGYELFQYKDDDGNRHTIDSQQVNEYIKEITNDDFTAKDFRTWGGSNIASTHLYKTGPYENKTQLKKVLSETCKTVSEHLGNTVAVCRSYYIHPTIFKTYETNLLIPHFGKHYGKKPKISGLSWDEEALLNLIKN